MTDRATRQLLLALERRAITQSAAIRDLTQRVERELGGALAAALRRIEALERERLILASPGSIPAAAPALEPRVPAAQAAEALGCDTRTIRRLIDSGQLRGSARSLTGSRRRWTVASASLERLIAKGGSPAAPAASKPPIPGARRSGAKG